MYYCVYFFSTFCTQSSRQMLLELSRQLLSGEGDITRHLGYIGYTVTYEQVSSLCVRDNTCPGHVNPHMRTYVQYMY